ncbi:MAG: hypothetical protein ACPGNV_00925 [Mangrovicoccus sp.]
MVDTTEAEIQKLQRAVEKERLEAELLRLRTENAKATQNLRSQPGTTEPKSASKVDMTMVLGSVIGAVLGLAAAAIALFH